MEENDLFLQYSNLVIFVFDVFEIIELHMQSNIKSYAIIKHNSEKWIRYPWQFSKLTLFYEILTVLIRNFHYLISPCIVSKIIFEN